jgi:hypothetical protein
MKLPARLRAFVSLLLLLTLLSACGGSGGSGTPVSTTRVNGFIFAGPVTGSTLTVKDASGKVVAGPITVDAVDGFYSVAVPSSALAGALVFEATGGHYTDEATMASGVALGGFSAYLEPGSLVAGAVVTLDPASTIIHKLVAGGMSPISARAAFLTAFGYTPDCSVAPAFANVSSSAPTAGRLAGLHAAYFSQLTKDLALSADRQSELVQALAEDLSDGVLDGKKGNLPVSTASGTPIPEDISVRFAASALGFQGSANNKSKLTPDKIGAPPCGKLALTASYRVEYLPASSGDVAGKDTFQLKITRRSDNSPATGLASDIVLTPLMVMSTMSSSSTWPGAVVETGEPGSYTGTLYYSMATTGLDMYWRLSVAIGQETAVFYPNVAALPAGNTVSAKLSNSSDKAGTANRVYRIWRDTLSAGSTGYDLTVFLSSTDAGNTLPVYAGAQWTASPLDLATVELSASSDGLSWLPLTPVGVSGRYTAHALPLSAGNTGKVYLALKINGRDYTTNGNLPDGNSDLTKTNAFATFSVTP